MARLKMRSVSSPSWSCYFFLWICPKKEVENNSPQPTLSPSLSPFSSRLVSGGQRSLVYIGAPAPDSASHNLARNHGNRMADSNEKCGALARSSLHVTELNNMNPDRTLSGARH